ncbi:uncharacterized protein [Nicotiana sylvestris]|uniref:Uncharacterized protein LOC104212688 n=1 Tax=Nicotiana sylvestris TaxID=4096 RepID=A0A1U7VES9_NICSY|nr:PREDICTED: uncharacterized protein LOC104212688 [Nicotiana sylvestris]
MSRSMDVAEFDELNSYLRELPVGYHEVIKGELLTFAWDNANERRRDHFFVASKDLYPNTMTWDLYSTLWFDLTTWASFEKDAYAVCRIDQKWAGEKNFHTTLAEALNKVVNVHESEIYLLEIDGQTRLALEDDSMEMMIYFFYNKNLKRLVCVKIATYEKFDMDEDEDEEEDHGDDDD